MLGEMSLLKDAPAMGHVVALDVSEAFYLSCEAFNAIYSEHAEFAEKIQNVVNQRQKANDARKAQGTNAVPVDPVSRRGPGALAGGPVAAARLYIQMSNWTAASRMRVDPAHGNDAGVDEN